MNSYHVSSNLNSFLNNPDEKPITKMQFYTAVIKYAKHNKLFHLFNKRYVVPDKTLCELFHIHNNDDMDLRNMPYYLSLHICSTSSK
jgi:chromatin remodeling complex protein RSC6